MLRSCSAPGKVFLLGEYAVLRGLPAVVVTAGPRFECDWRGDLEVAETVSHPKSPAGKLGEYLKSSNIKMPGGFVFRDSLRGAGGLGASTAEFAFLCAAAGEVLPELRTWRGAWELYRKLTVQGSSAPSGADLVTQMEGGVVLFDPSTPSVEQISESMNKFSVLVFLATSNAGRKVATHSHLKDVFGKEDFLAPGSADLGRLEKQLREGIFAIHEGDAVRLGKSLTAYAESLRACGLECLPAFEDRMALSRLPGVLGVKGAGALLSDAVIVLMDSRMPEHEAAQNQVEVVFRAESRGLRWLHEAVGTQAGLEGLS